MQGIPRVSIGMPLYQAERYLEETLATILAQTFRDFELIISDNASTDRTEEICRRHMALDDRISYSRNERNMGAAYNYNRVVHLARGEYFKHAAYDDLLAPTYLERLVELLNREPDVVLAYPNCCVIDGNGEPLASAPAVTDLVSRDASPHVRLERYIPRGGAAGMCDPVFGLFRTAVLRQTAILGSYVSADAILLGETMLYGQVENVPETLFFERYHERGSVISNPSIDQRYAWFDPAIRPRASNRLYHWRWLIELVRAIHRAPLSWTERLRCYFVLRRYVMTSRKVLVLNILWAGHFSMRRIWSGIRKRDMTDLIAAFR